jgi:ParB/RepB/Spo0J family partition protein
MAEVKLIDPKKISGNPFNPRRDFNEEALDELAQSIKELGLLQPPTVYPEGDLHRTISPKGMEYVVLCGERRVKACQKLRLKEIACNVIEEPANEQEALQLALVENLQREDLSIAEEAPAICSLVEGGMKRAALAKALGKSPNYVGSRYAVAKHAEVLEAFLANGGKDLEAWSLVGGIESADIRRRIIKSCSSYMGPDKGAVNTVRALEKHLGTDLKARQLSQFVQQYANPKNKIERCAGEGFGCDKEKCKHFQELGARVAGWLGLKAENTWSYTYLCSAEDQVCLTYKKDREKAALKKVESIDPARLLDSTNAYFDGEWTKIDMEELCDKKCTGCWQRYEVPTALRRSLEVPEYPYVYCVAADGSCFDAKKKAYDKALEGGDKKSYRTWLSREEAQQKTDEELEQLVIEEIRKRPEDVLEGSDNQAVYVLGERGFIPEISVEITWTKFEPPEECTEDQPEGCWFAVGGYSCPEMCPHAEDGQPKDPETADEGATA